MPGRKTDLPMGRLVHKADFERVLTTPSRSRSTHFAVHHVSSRPTSTVWCAKPAGNTELSTAPAPVCPPPVDDSPAGHWLGTVVPKRHARRSVTRSLLKRQIRSVIACHLAALPPGLWLVRLRSPFAPKQFPSAASKALRLAVLNELGELIARTAAR